MKARLVKTDIGFQVQVGPLTYDVTADVEAILADDRQEHAQQLAEEKRVMQRELDDFHAVLKICTPHCQPFAG